MKKVLIVGMYGAGNIGDDLILDSAIDILNISDISTKISLVSYNPHFHKNIYKKYDVYGVSKKQKILSIVNNDIILIAGGTSCQDKMGAGFLKGILFWYIEYLLFAKILKKKVIFWSIGCDFLESKFGKVYARLLNIADKIIVRDPKSKENMQLYVASSKIFISNDLAYSYDKYSVTSYNKVYIDLIKQLKNVVIVNVLNEFISTDLHKEYLVQLIKDNPSINYVFVNSEIRNNFDHLAVMSILDSFNTEIPNNVFYFGTNYFTPAELNSIVACATMVISMRMHFAILSVINNKHTFIISRSDKTDSFSKLNNIEYWNLAEDLSYEEFVEKLTINNLNVNYKNSITKTSLLEEVEYFLK